MDEKTLAAVRSSIAKWEAVSRGVLADLGAENCPLCKAFASIEDEDGIECWGCPVRARTGMPGCCGSPYDQWMEANLYRERGDREKGRWWADDASLVRLAKAELDFLRSLVP